MIEPIGFFDIPLKMDEDLLDGGNMISPGVGKDSNVVNGDLNFFFFKIAEGILLQVGYPQSRKSHSCSGWHLEQDGWAGQGGHG